MVDEALITVVGGKGGDGVVSFFPFKGGPDGGDGGKGGDIYAVLNSNITDLRKFLEKTKYEAEDGKKGQSRRCQGEGAPDLELQMPSGTTIIDTKTRKEVELNKKNPRILLVHGGAGGYGNDAFKSSTNRTPRQTKPGNIGQEKQVKLILKLIADYGFIGLPNAGKSSLLSELTSANPKIANYAFTTLEPNLGALGDKILADIPGLIEGASKGKGLGVKFLKHIEKVKLLIHCISVENENVEEIYKTVRKELEAYNPGLLEKEEIILLTKIDLAEQEDIKKKLKILKKLNPQVYPLSIHDWESLEKLKNIITA